MGTNHDRRVAEELAVELGESEAGELLGTFPARIRRAISPEWYGGDYGRPTVGDLVSSMRDDPKAAGRVTRSTRSPAPYAESTDRVKLDALAHNDEKARANLPELGGRTYVGSLASEISRASEWATVSVGRNLGNDGSDKLGLDEWARFRLAIDDLFDPIGGDFRVVGISYSGEHGTEDTYVVGGTLHIDRVPVRAVLARLARRYGQTAIALVFGGERISAECEHESVSVNGNTVCDACGQVNP